MGVLGIVALGASFGLGTCELSQLTVKILTQKRVSSLNRLLASLDAASYPETANIDVEIHVDQIAPSGSWLWTWGALKTEAKQRREVLNAAVVFVENWKHGYAKVMQARKWRGVRGMWLACSDPGIFGEEFTRVVILEDDIELSPAWCVSTSRGVCWFCTQHPPASSFLECLSVVGSST